MPHTPAFAAVRRLFAVAGWARLHGVDPKTAACQLEQAWLQRRALLKGAGASLAIAPLAACGGTTDEEPSKPEDVRVAVVGGGIAGLHCAHRLREAGFDATLYEGQNRVGGRMWTDRETFGNGLLFEVGGELIDSNHATLFALAEEFAIQLDDRWSFETPGMVRETNYVAGARVTNETLLAQTLEVADLMAMQVEAADSDDAAFEMFDALTLTEWLDTYVPVATYPELHAVLDAAYLGEFGLENNEQSSLNLLYLFGWDSTDEFLIFGDSDERWHTHLGNDTFTTALAGAIGSDRVELGKRLVKASGSADGPYTLTFEDGTEVQADHVVFALPFSTLRKVDLADLELSDDKRAAIAELGYGTNAKVMGRFSRRPWWDDHGESGLLTCDLGVQQGWDTTIGQDATTGGVWTNFLGGTQGAMSINGTPEEWFDGILDDLEVIWPGSRDAWEGVAARMHWPTFEWSQGSYTCYRPGQWAYWSTEGVREGNVHFCGEHCSLDFQGWMEGAAETGGLVATEIIDDYGAERSAGLRRAMATKLAVPQACYRATPGPRMRWRDRRRARVAAALTGG